jgi:tRNA dimethylallyltransferase
MADGLVITGPTATGKSDLALQVAERVGGEIVSMDSRQVYRGMDIGTAKPTPEQRRRVPHHGLDLVDPSERYSAGRFARDARGWVADIQARGCVPILVGGTGFFLHALLRPLFQEPALPAERRERLKRYLASQPEPRLRDWLLRLDPVSARRLATGGGRQRVARALEVVLLTGRSLPWWQTHAPADANPLELCVFVLTLPRERLYQRIDQRVTEMAEHGLVEEVERLLSEGFDPADPGLNATGYIELIPYFRGERSLDAALDDVRRSTRRYARRQLTWFRNQLPSGARWLDATRPPSELAEEIETSWRNAN